MMDWHVTAFLKASLSWLVAGITLGVVMAAYPAWILYRPAHAHLLVLGFVAMMIFGVAYHVIPRFTGNAIHSRTAPVVHWWLSNIGLALLVVGFVSRAHGAPVAKMPMIVGGLLAASGAYVFAYVIWRTIDGRPELRAAAEQAARRMPGGGPGESGRRLPVA